MANKTLKTIQFPGLPDTYTIPSEDAQNKVTSISSSSTDTQYPSAKAVYTLFENTRGGWTYEQVKLLETILHNVMWTNDNNGAAWIGTVNKLIYSLLGNSYDPQAPDENGVLTLVSAPMDINSDGILTLE